MMRMSGVCLMFLINGLTSNLFAQTGKLPKGQKPSMEHLVSAPKKKAPRANCLNLFAKPYGTTGLFDLKDENFYFLAKKSKGKAQTFEYDILKYQIGTKNIELLAKTRASEVDAILVYGNKPDGISLVSFQDHAVACKSGSASHLTISLHLDNNRPKVIKSSDELEITESETGPIIFVKDKNSYLEHDLKQSQSRLAPAELRNGERPLFVDRKRRLQYVFKMPKDANDKDFGLIAYKNNKTIAASLKFLSGDLLLQQKNLFGVARRDAKTNQFTIKEVKMWSGVGKTADYKVKIPDRFKVEDAALKVNFKSKKLAVLANSRELMKRWRSVFLYDYTKGAKPFAVFNPRVGKFVSYVGISSNGTHGIVITASLKTEKDENLALYDFKTRKWTIVKIP